MLHILPPLAENSYMDVELQRLKVAAGVETVNLQGTGVYHYRLSDSVKNVSTCSVVSSPGQRVGGTLVVVVVVVVVVV